LACRAGDIVEFGREKGRPCEIASLHFVNFTGQAVAVAGIYKQYGGGTVRVSGLVG